MFTPSNDLNIPTSSLEKSMTARSPNPVAFFGSSDISTTPGNRPSLRDAGSSSASTNGNLASFETPKSRKQDVSLFGRPESENDQENKRLFTGNYISSKTSELEDTRSLMCVDDIPLPQNSITSTPVRYSSNTASSIKSRVRGIDLHATKSFRDTPRSTAKNHEEADVTTAVELVTVKSPWVTVYGYPNGASAAVLRYMQNFGEILQHVSEHGNWMHLLFSNKLQASRAIAQNGQRIQLDDHRVLMIGVKPSSELGLEGQQSRVSQNPVTVPSMRTSSWNRSAGETRGSSYAKNRLPSRSASMCKRFWTWLLDL